MAWRRPGGRWAVKLVGEHTETWLADLRTAMQEVDKLRSQGPGL